MSTTPGQMAKRWAKEHPEAEGLLMVDSLAPRGRGGWKGLAGRRTGFLVQGGRARMRTRKRMEEDGWYGYTSFAHNGWCWRCGKLFLEPVLRWYYVWRADAGVPTGYDWIPGTVFAEYGWAYVCPGCVVGSDLRPKEYERLVRPEVRFDEYCGFLGGGWPEEYAPAGVLATISVSE